MFLCKRNRHRTLSFSHDIPIYQAVNRALDKFRHVNVKYIRIDFVLGAWASSPPLPLVVDFDQFKAATGPAYHTVGRNACYNTFEKAFNRTVKHWDADEFDIFIRTCDSLEEEGAAELYAILSTFQ